MAKHLTVYHYAKCGTCRSAIKWLREHGYELELIDLFETAPAVEQLEKIIAQSGLPMNKFWNTSGEVYREQGLKNVLPSLSEQERLALLASNGRLIKRPIATDGNGKVTVGYKPEQYEEAWGKG